jgi:hypothetical protein
MTDDNQQPSWAEELAKDVAAFQRQLDKNDALRQAILQIAKNIKMYAWDGHEWDGMVTRPVPVVTFAELLANMFAAVRELPPAVAVYPQVATASGTAPSPAIRTSYTASGILPSVPKRSPLAGLSPGQKTALVLVWVIAYVLPPLQTALPADYQTLATDAAAWWGIALAITYAILANRK